jgi:sugar phosphate isomerase/epimerase
MHMIGVSTFCLHKQPLMTALDQISAITDTIEVMDDGPHHIESSELLESYVVTFALHAPSRGVNIASVLEPIRRASVEVTGHCFRIAAEVDAHVIVHPGYFAWEEEREQATRQFIRSLSDLDNLAKEYSITYYFENMGNWNYFFLRYPSELPLIGGTGLALDVGHAYLNKCLDAFLECPIRHVHIHDNDGKDDAHLPVGDGTIDFGRVMDAVIQNGAVPIIEVSSFTGVQDSITRLEQIARRSS